MTPSSLKELSEDKLKSIQSYYGKFLSIDERENLVTDITKWKKKYKNVALQDKPKSVFMAFSECNAQTFPILHKVFINYLLQLHGSTYIMRTMFFYSKSSEVVDKIIHD